MKAMNYIDLAVQTLILGLLLLSSLFISFTGHFESIAMVAMYGALILGPWQFVSSLVTTLSKGLYLKWRRIHLLSSLAYFVVFGVGVAYFSDLEGSEALRLIAGVVGFGIPVVLAVFYYFITVKSFQLARVKS